MTNNLKKPPMGWNSWDCFGASVKESEVRENAKYMAQKLKPYGWEYVVVDIQWSEPTADSNEYHDGAPLEMDEYSRLIPAVYRFPSAADGKGFRPLSDYVHSLGLKFGIHIMRGIPRQAVRDKTKILGTNVTADMIADTSSVCKWNTDMYGVDCTKPGAQEYYDSIVAMYADWGVDFIKCDDMAAPIYHKKEVEALDAAIDKCGRSMILSLSPGDAHVEEAEHLAKHANMWRMTDDFWDSWDTLKKMFDYCHRWANHRSVGHYPDCDMLPLGKIGIRSLGGARTTNFTRDEQMTMLTLWSIFQSPLMFGGDLTRNDDFTESLITNKELYEMYHTLKNSREIDVGVKATGWVAEGDGCVYLAVFNLNDKAIEFNSPLNILGENKFSSYTEIWEGKKEDISSGNIKATINPHGVKLFKLA